MSRPISARTSTMASISLFSWNSILPASLSIASFGSLGSYAMTGMPYSAPIASAELGPNTSTFFPQSGHCR